MLIKEENLRKIIREELLKEHKKNKLKILEEGFLSDLADNTGLVLTTGILALIANVGKALANPVSKDNLQYWKDKNTKIESMVKDVRKNTNLPPGVKIKFDKCNELGKKLDDFVKANEKHANIQGTYEKNLDSDNPNMKINKMYDRIEKEAQDALNDLNTLQQQCQKDVRDAKKLIEDELANKVVKKTYEDYN